MPLRFVISTEVKPLKPRSVWKAVRFCEVRANLTRCSKAFEAKKEERVFRASVPNLTLLILVFSP